MSKTADQRKIISPVNTERRQEVDVQTGDTVRVTTKIPEGNGEFRRQPFEGIVLSRKHGNEAGATFTVRQEIDGVGVEKIFPLYSPRIDEIEVLRRARTRRAKLYHIRDKAARQIRREMRRMVNVDLSTKTEEDAEDEDQENQVEEDGKTEDASDEDLADEADEVSGQEDSDEEDDEVEASDSEPKSRSPENDEGSGEGDEPQEDDEGDTEEN